MKKSEMESFLREEIGQLLQIGTVRDLLQRMEEKGQKWDPEEPLPERLRLCENSGGFYIVPHPTDTQPHEWQGRHDMKRGLAEAVRRYNAWPKLHQIAQQLEPTGDEGRIAEIHRALVSILDGGPS